jgi:hypothetical protein
MNTKSLLVITIYCLFFIASYAKDRAAELRDEMWNSKDKDFLVTQIPQKWDHESAVIIAQLTRFEYKKPVLTKHLIYNTYRHYRIKLIDKKSIEEYKEISYYDDTNYLNAYAGAKLIKPNGKELIVDLSTAVRMERESNEGIVAYKKLAIPNLEPGDILDYYICEEKTVPIISFFHVFTPVIHNLPQEYPLMKQKVQFLVQRKCYINLRSFNGAPKLKLVTDEEKDEEYYSLEDGDREGMKNVRWLYANRELPSIKFRVLYKTGAFDIGALIGEQGVAKTSTTGKELYESCQTMIRTSVGYGVKDFSKLLKKSYPTVTDPIQISKLAYYYVRNKVNAEDEVNTLKQEPHYATRDLVFMNDFRNLLNAKDIPSEPVITVARHISSLEDMLLEAEPDYMLRVKGKDNQYTYFTTPSIFSTAGMLPSRYEGVEAYAYPKNNKDGVKVKLPTTRSDVNASAKSIVVKIPDFNTATLSVTETLTGLNKVAGQYEFLDTYDAIAEDDKTYEPHESFNGYSGATRKKFVAMKEEYLARREKVRLETLKESLKNEYDFETNDVSDFVIKQTGRLETAPAMMYSYTFKSEGLISKSGPNYLFNVGKLMGGQVKIEKEEMDRKYNIYFDNARTYTYKIVVEIPAGYEVLGIDKLNQKVESKSGGFASTAKLEGTNVVIETIKHYDVNFATKDEWPSIVDFLNAANTFSEQKLLLRKK